MRTFVLRSRAAPTDSQKLLASVGKEAHTEILAHTLMNAIFVAQSHRADVTVYDYQDDTLVTRTVNLDTGKVERTATQRGVQPPLSLAEQAEAAKLLIADPLGADLKADYKDATGKELTSPNQLQLSSMVYRAAPGGSASVEKCGEHRCTRLFPKVKNGPWVDARDFVIDLSARKVIRLG